MPMIIQARGITVTCHTEQDIVDVCAVLNAGEWTDYEIELYEQLIEMEIPSAEAIRRVEESRKLKAS